MLKSLLFFHLLIVISIFAAICSGCESKTDKSTPSASIAGQQENIHQHPSTSQIQDTWSKVKNNYSHLCQDLIDGNSAPFKEERDLRAWLAHEWNITPLSSTEQFLRANSDKFLYYIALYHAANQPLNIFALLDERYKADFQLLYDALADKSPNTVCEMREILWQSVVPMKNISNTAKQLRLSDFPAKAQLLHAIVKKEENTSTPHFFPDREIPTVYPPLFINSDSEAYVVLKNSMLLISQSQGETLPDEGKITIKDDLVTALQKFSLIKLPQLITAEKKYIASFFDSQKPQRPSEQEKIFNNCQQVYKNMEQINTYIEKLAEKTKK